MSPLNIKILLHYYAIPGDYHRTVPIEHAASGAVHETMEWFVREGLLSSWFLDVTWAMDQVVQHTPREVAPDVATNQFFKITDKGSAMVDHLMAVQIPVCKWVQPS